MAGDQLGTLDPRVTNRLPYLKSPFLLPWPSVQADQFRRAFSRHAPDVSLKNVTSIG